MEDRNIYIVRCGEVALKGMNKPYFERMLVERIRKVLKKHKGIEIRREDGLIVVRTIKDISRDTVIGEISKVFGVASISPAIEVESDMEAIEQAAVAYMKQLIEEKGIRTFKVEAKRSDKNFPIQSPDIARQIGAKILIGCRVLKVDVLQPECRLHIHVRRE